MRYSIARFAAGTPDKPDTPGGFYATARTLKGAKERARRDHELDGKAYVVCRGDRSDEVCLRIPENPDHVAPDFQVMPALSEEEYQALKESIAERGLDYPILKIGGGAGVIIDGHHRERAIKELEAEGRKIPTGGAAGYAWERYKYVTIASVEEGRELAWQSNMQRRHLSREQKRELVAAKLKESPEWSDRRTAQLMGVSPTTVGSVRAELEATVQLGQSDKRVGADGKVRGMPATTSVEEVDLPPVPDVVVGDGHRLEPAGSREEAAPWTEEELELFETYEAGEEIVIRMPKKGDPAHGNLMEWAQKAGVFALIDRRSKWGNPFEMDEPGSPKDGDRDTVCDAFDWYFDHKPSLQRQLPELRGKVFGCWCWPQRCHGLTLIKHLSQRG